MNVSLVKTGIKKVYIGETSRTFFDRASEHTKALATKDNTYAIVKHWETDHPEILEPPEFSFNVLKTHHRAIHRQIWEGIHIQATPDDQLMNSKSEWGLNPIPRLMTSFPIDGLKPESYPGGPGKKLDLPGHIDPQKRQLDQETILDDFQAKYKQRKRRRQEQQKQQGEVPGPPDVPGDPPTHQDLQKQAQGPP